MILTLGLVVWRYLIDWCGVHGKRLIQESHEFQFKAINMNVIKHLTNMTTTTTTTNNNRKREWKRQTHAHTMLLTKTIAATIYIQCDKNRFPIKLSFLVNLLSLRLQLLRIMNGIKRKKEKTKNVFFHMKRKRTKQFYFQLCELWCHCKMVKENKKSKHI